MALSNDGDGAMRSAGWYPDPSMANTQRYWDGACWTEHVAPMAAVPLTRAVGGSRAEQADKRGSTTDDVAGGVLKAVFLLAIVLIGAGIVLFGLPMLVDQDAGVFFGVVLIGIAVAVWLYARKPEKPRHPWAWWELAIVGILGLFVLGGLISAEQSRQRDDQIKREIDQACETSTFC